MPMLLRRKARYVTVVLAVVFVLVKVVFVVVVVLW
jgi:hypothetical protein